MANQDIKRWLNSDRDYETGIAIYRHYGSSETLKRMFSWGKTAYNQEKLIEALEGLVSSETTQIQAGSLWFAGNSPLETALTQVAISDEIEKLDKTWKPIYKEASFKHSQLHHVAPEERKKLAFEILESFETMEPIWEKKDKLVKGEVIPEETPVIEPESAPQTPVQMLRRITNLTVQISKHSKNEKRSAEVAAWKKERDELKEYLKINHHLDPKLQKDGHS